MRSPVSDGADRAAVDQRRHPCPSGTRDVTFYFGQHVEDAELAETGEGK
jgi:hypothetical protein